MRGDGSLQHQLALVKPSHPSLFVGQEMVSGIRCPLVPTLHATILTALSARVDGKPEPYYSYKRSFTWNHLINTKIGDFNLQTTFVIFDVYMSFS